MLRYVSYSEHCQLFNKQKKNLLRLLLLLGTIISLFFVPWIIVKAWILPLPKTIDAQLEQALNLGFDGIIVYVQKANKPEEIYTAGWHDRDAKIPARADALFKIASINKLYIAAAITKLAASGEIDLDATLAQYFPELSSRIENAQQITIRQMVQHKSGIANYTDTIDFWNIPQKDRQYKLSLILDAPASFSPGESYQYSNSNYLLLAMLIEKIVGYSDFQYIAEQILKPVQLEHTYFSLSDITLPDLMSGYYVGVEPDIKSNNYGAMIATVTDVGRFIKALNDGSLFTDDEQSIYESLYPLGHGGLMPGYQSLAFYHPEIDAVVVQFINTTDLSGYEWNLSQVVYNRVVKILAKAEQ